MGGLQNLLGMVVLGECILIVIEDETHRILQVFKLLRLDFLDLVIGHFMILNQLIELFCRKILDLQTQAFS
jgi:hypothetical protein